MTLKYGNINFSEIKSVFGLSFMLASCVYDSLVTPNFKISVGSSAIYILSKSDFSVAHKSSYVQQCCKTY